MARIVGFTGTRRGMTELQKVKVRLLFRGMTELHHGDCQGSDVQAAVIARGIRTQAGKQVWIVAHPCNLMFVRGHGPADETRPIKHPLARDLDIAREVQEVIATPSGYHQVLRSGMWATVRYALRLKRPVMLIFPDGSTRRVTSKEELP